MKNKEKRVKTPNEGSTLADDMMNINTKGAIKKLAPCLKGHIWESIVSVITVFCEGVFEIYIPFIMADLIDNGINAAEGGDFSVIITKGLLMIGLAVLSLICGVLCARYAAYASTGFAKNIRSTLFNKIEAFSFSNMDKFTTASLVTRLTNDITNVQNIFQMIIRACFRSPVMLIFATIMAIRLNAEMALIFAIALPVLAIALTWIAIKAYPKFQIMLKKYDTMNRSVQEDLIAIRVVKSFVREGYEKKNFRDRSDELQWVSKAAERIVVINNPISQLVLYACMVAVCAIGGTQIMAGTMTSGQLMSFISYVSQILMSIMMISMIFISLVLSRASISRIVEVIDEKIDITDDNANRELSVSEGSIEFDHVTFSYAGQGGAPVLRDINLTIRAGETVGLIGGTGSSKTTLVQMIPRLYDVTEGSIRVGGHDVREYTLEHLRDRVAMVLQNNVLFSGTIADNLRWGDKNATQEEVERAARLACAHDFITEFPEGYDTYLGQGGVNVSGGQKQRLCIARALLKKPDIIILDDSTSAVDMNTDAKIRAALREELSGTTTIIIAQRIASVMDADKIIVMDEGKIVDIGNHAELMQRCDIYREVYTSQNQSTEEVA